MGQIMQRMLSSLRFELSALLERPLFRWALLIILAIAMALLSQWAVLSLFVLPVMLVGLLLASRLHQDGTVGLPYSHHQLDGLFEQSFHGLMFLMLDEPLLWDDVIDKEAMLQKIFTHERITRVNAGVVAQMQVSSDALVGRSPVALFPDDVAAGQRLWRQLLDSEHVFYARELKRADKTTVVLEEHYVGLYDEQRHLIGHYVVQRDVTARRQAEQDLREAQARYRSLFQQSNDAVFILALSGTHMEANPRAAEMFGYTLEEIQTLTLQNLSAEVDASLETRQRLLAGEALPLYERNFRRKNGEVFPVEVNVQLVRDETGAPLHIQSVLRDLSQRKQMEQALRESEIRYRSIVSAMAEGVVLQDQNGQILTCNHAAETILGLSEDQMKGRTSIDPRWQAIHEDGSPFPGQDHPAMVTLRTGLPQRNVVMGVKKLEGILSWISINSQPLIQPGEDQPYAVVASFTDISEQRMTQNALQRSQERLQGILNTMPDVVWSIDARTSDLLYINPAVQQVYGREPSEFYRDANLWVSLIHPDDRQHLEGFRQRILAHDADETEYRIIHRDGSIRWLDLRARLIQDKDGQAGRIDGYAVDITERKKAADQAFALAIEKERVNVLTQFIQHASHELRTPLSIINSSLYLMTLAKDSEKLQRYARNGEQQIASLTRLIDMMVMMVKLDNNPRLNLTSTTIENVIAAATQARQQSMQRQQITLRTAVGDGLPMLRIDMYWMQQALEQLLDNAIRFNRVGGEITLSTELHQESEVIIRIHDTGSGITEEALPHIFERFWRQDEAHTTPGFGLGLPIARQIIDLHAGRIEVESAAGEGSTFMVYLPLTSMPVLARAS